MGFWLICWFPKCLHVSGNGLSLSPRLLIMLFDGFSRIFQGNHYLTDVLAGYALGIAWAGLVYTVDRKNFYEKEELKMSKKEKVIACKTDRQSWCWQT